MKRITVIYNPAAGQGSAANRLADVESRLRAYGIEPKFLLTEAPSHAIDLARAAAEAGDTDAIVAAGGDGTANEVINGVMAARNAGHEPPPVGVICVGRGNDFAYGAGIPTELSAAIETVATGVATYMDLGHLRGGNYPDGRYFGNGIGIGFDTVVGFQAARMKRIKGFAGYVIGALKTLLLFYTAPTVEVTTDAGSFTRPCIQISVMNGQRMGGAFFMAPNAVTNDGELDLCIAGAPRRLRMLALIVKYLGGRQEGDPHITTGRTRRFTIRAIEGALPIHADGETISEDHASLEVECVPKALLVIRPAAATTPPTS